MHLQVCPCWMTKATRGQWRSRFAVKRKQQRKGMGKLSKWWLLCSKEPCQRWKGCIRFWKSRSFQLRPQMGVVSTECLHHAATCLSLLLIQYQRLFESCLSPWPIQYRRFELDQRQLKGKGPRDFRSHPSRMISRRTRVNSLCASQAPSYYKHRPQMCQWSSEVPNQIYNPFNYNKL